MNNHNNLRNTEEDRLSSLLDSPETVIPEYEQTGLSIPFAGDNLALLEEQMTGGLLAGRCYLLGEIPSSVKGVLANNMADNICLNGNPVLFFSHDNPKLELQLQTLARFSDHTIDAFYRKSVSTQDIKEICDGETIKNIMNLKYIVQEVIPVEKWGRLIEQILEKHKKAPALFIDPLRKLYSGRDIPDERQRIEAITSRLVDLAKGYGVPIFVVSELIRGVYQVRKKVGISSFREPGALEYEASWVGVLAVAEKDGPGYVIRQNWENLIEKDKGLDLIVLKAKRGTGVIGRIPLYIDKSKMLIKDREDSSLEDSSLSGSSDSIGNDYSQLLDKL